MNSTQHKYIIRERNHMKIHQL
ncbi:hypothetical protein OIU74_019537 [Salix koriyanagi]|uniref:Uncharacterized protein n=1 Tax=Salix koriyanagi TaxID=2511006 RepID=A0A9Q0SKT6_9ROSI|nr:hypothetical protein OIU74_019537 [Salix koriyanagi]